MASPNSRSASRVAPGSRQPDREQCRAQIAVSGFCSPNTAFWRASSRSGAGDAGVEIVGVEERRM